MGEHYDVLTGVKLEDKFAACVGTALMLPIQKNCTLGGSLHRYRGRFSCFRFYHQRDPSRSCSLENLRRHATVASLNVFRRHPPPGVHSIR